MPDTAARAVNLFQFFGPDVEWKRPASKSVLEIRILRSAYIHKGSCSYCEKWKGREGGGVGKGRERGGEGMGKGRGEGWEGGRVREGKGEV